MSVFRDILSILTTSNGGIAYYLVLLFSVWAMAGLALSRWSRGERRGIVSRLLVVSGLMSFGRFLLFLFALLDQDTISLAVLGPPTERLIDAVSLVLVFWAFVDTSRLRALRGILVGMATFVFVAFFVLAVMQWSVSWQTDTSLAYNSFWQHWVWEGGQLLFALLALAYLAAAPVPDHGLLVVGLGALGIGHLLQIALPFAEQIRHFAGWVRFANVVAFPLFAVAAFRAIVQRFDVEVTELRAVSQESLSQVTGLMDLVDVNRKVGSSLVIHVVLENALRSIAQTVSTNLCSIAFVTRPDQGEMELAGVFDSHQINQECVRFVAQDYPAIDHAVTRDKPVVLAPDENGNTAAIYRLLGHKAAGPIIIQPLELSEEQAASTGLILACRPGSARPFTPVEIRKCETLSRHISVAIRNAQRYQALENRNEQMTADLRLIEIDHSRVTADLDNRLKQSQNELSLYIQKLYEMESSEQRTHTDMGELREQLHQARQANREMEQVKAQLQDRLEQIARLTRDLSQSDAARRQLEEQNADLSTRLTQAQNSRNDLGDQLGQLQARFAERELTIERESDSPIDLGTIAVDAMLCGAMLCDARGQITRLNETAERMLGSDAAQLMGKAASELWPDDTWRAAVHSVTDRYAGTPGVGPFVVRRAHRSFEVTLAPLHVAGRHIGAVVTIHDASPVAEHVQARDEFLSSLAQELRTPMTSIVGYTELLLSGSVGELDEMSRKFLQRVQANIERMGGMLNDLVGVTAIDLGKLVIELEQVDMSHLIETALHKVQFRLEEKELKAHLDIQALPTIYVDPDSMQQVLDNLLTNACKSSEARTTIVIKAQRQVDDSANSFLHISVADTGGGVAPRDRPRVFDRFYRADDALISGLGETGVGLSIVKALVEAHDGHVWIESTVGEGSTFHFTIPFGLEDRIDSGEKEYSIKGNGYG